VGKIEAEETEAGMDEVVDKHFLEQDGQPLAFASLDRNSVVLETPSSLLKLR
jgi:hypothetical protein